MTVLTPALSSKEREKRSLCFLKDTSWIDVRFILPGYLRTATKHGYGRQVACRTVVLLRREIYFEVLSCVSGVPGLKILSNGNTEPSTAGNSRQVD